MSQWGMFIPIRPVAVQSGRFAGHYYMDKKHRDYKDTVSTYVAANRPDKLLSGPLALQIVFMFKWAKHISQKIRSSGISFRSGIPDLDNLKKGTVDSLRKLVMADDSQIVGDIGIFKVDGPVDGMAILLTEIEGAEDEMKELATGVLMQCNPPLDILNFLRQTA